MLRQIEPQVGWLCVVVCRCRCRFRCCVWLCVVVVLCVRCGVVWCGVVCGVTRWKTPCVHQKRPRGCRYTRRRFERTHGKGGVIVSSAHQNLPTKGYHVPQRFIQQRNSWMLPIFSLRIGREQHVAESSIYSLHLNTPVNSRHMTQRHTQTRTHTHNTAQNTPQEVKETKRDRDEKRYK